MALSFRVTDDVITGDADLGAAVGVGLQGPVGAQVLVVTAPAGVHHTESVHLVGDLATHVRKVSPAVTPGIAGLHVYGVWAVGVVLPHPSDAVGTEAPAGPSQEGEEQDGEL